MAYKSKKKNKQHTQKLNVDSKNWRNVKRRNRNISTARSNMRQYGISAEQIESILVLQGVIEDHERIDI